MFVEWWPEVRGEKFGGYVQDLCYEVVIEERPHLHLSEKNFIIQSMRCFAEDAMRFFVSGLAAIISVTLLTFPGNSITTNRVPYNAMR